jgi:hypothetical protein
MAIRQLDLLDVCARKHRGSKTSAEAHDKVVPRKQALRAMILTFVKEQLFGATVEEISEALRIRYTTASARVSELKRDGLLRISESRRQTATGCFAAVHYCTKEMYEA